MFYLRLKIAGLIFVVIMFCAGFSPLYGQDDQQKSIELTEYVAKSAWFYGICKLTVWPGIIDTVSLFKIAVIGENNAGMEIIEPGNNLIGGRKIDFRKINSIAEIKDSEALFIYSSMSDSLESIIDYVKDKPILTFGDTKGFAERGVIINFYLEDNEVKFELNQKYYQQSLVTIRAQILIKGKKISK